MSAATAQWLSLPGLALVVATNSAPVIASWLAGKRMAWPLDFGAVLGDGERLLGANKTWRGLAAAAMAGAGLAPWLALPSWLGAAAGAATIVGDALSSFGKRRLRLRPGTWVPVLDQLPEAALPLLVSWHALGLDLGQFLVTVAAFAVLDLVASRTLGSSRARVRIPASPERRDNDAIMDAKHARVRLLDLRNRLAARLQRIDRHIHHRDEPLPADSEERAGELGNRETLESLDDETTVELRQVDHALARLDTGLFGSCESCQLPIGTDRLQLLPFATKCVRCAARP